MIEIDDRTLLQSEPGLARLLEHYLALGQADRQAWHDRVMYLEEVPPAELTRWHGRLLAADWIEQQTATAPRFERDRVVASYRATAAGRRAMAR
ncbi:MAG: hypothetical protein K1X57_03530 [Gemmataceae bacterium]|nr:hypothetical protein [Gemmataceae bacterium]